MSHERRAELAANLADVRGQIAAACRAAGRDPDDVTLVVVTKTWPAEDVATLAELGVTDVGENRDQEAAPKHRALGSSPLRWHFVGQLQTNKARSVAAYADVVESVDRESLVRALAAARDPSMPLEVLLQVSLDDEASEGQGWERERQPPGQGRGGARREDVPALADLVEASRPLVLRGLMGVAPLGADPDAAFARLREMSEALRVDHPGATIISAGMSGDLEAAVRQGSTHVRVGTAVLGHRSGSL